MLNRVGSAAFFEETPADRPESCLVIVAPTRDLFASTIPHMFSRRISFVTIATFGLGAFVAAAIGVTLYMSSIAATKDLASGCA